MNIVTNNAGQEIVLDDEEEIKSDLIATSNELALGVKLPSTVKTPLNYLNYSRNYSNLYNDIYRQMEVAWKMYQFNSIIGNAVDVLVDFAVTEVYPEETGNKELDVILRYFFENLNYNNSNTVPGIYPLMQELGLEWFTSGNAFPYDRWDNVEVPELNSKYKIITTINLLNPQSIYIPPGPIAFGQEVLYLKYDDKLYEKLRSDGRGDPEAALLKSAVPRSVLDAIKNKSSLSAGPGIRLNPKYISHLKRKAKGYHTWGIPLLSRCLASCSLMERLKELDDSISTGLINLITIFRIGNDLFPASEARLHKFANLIRNPKATTTLVWAHDVDILQVGPDGKLLAFKDKYKDSKEDLLIGLGIPPVLMSLSQQGNEWVSILSLVEKLTNWRKIMSIWLEKKCNEISKQNGFTETVHVQWERMNLKDEASIKNLILAFYDRGLISIKTSLQQANYDISTEESRKKEEKPKQELFMPPQLPFSGKEVEKTKPNEEDTKSVKKNIKSTETKSKTTFDENKSSKPKKMKPKEPEAPKED